MDAAAIVLGMKDKMTMLQQTIKELQESELAGPSNNAEQLGTLQNANAALQRQNDELKARVAQLESSTAHSSKPSSPNSPVAASSPVAAAEGQVVTLQAQVNSLKAEVASLKQLSNKDSDRQVQVLQKEVELLRAGALQGASIAQMIGLGEEFEFERRVYQCEVAPPGVGYRHTPRFNDKNKDGCGPQAPHCIVADAICQGPNAVFIRCTSGHGWLPLSDAKNSRFCFKHVGKEDETNLETLGLELNDPAHDNVAVERAKFAEAAASGKSSDRAKRYSRTSSGRASGSGRISSGRGSGRNSGGVTSGTATNISPPRGK